MYAGFDRVTLAAASPPGRSSSLPPGYRVPGAAHLVMTGLDFEPMWKRLGAPTVPCDTCSPPCVVHRNVWPELVRSADDLLMQQQQPLRVAYNNGNPHVAHNNKTGARGQVLLSTNNGDHLYGLSHQEQRLLAGLYSWHTENAVGNHSRLFPLPLGPGIADNAGWMIKGAKAAPGAQTGDESAKTHSEQDRLQLMGRIRAESHAKWPKRRQRPILAFMENFGAYYNHVNDSKPPIGLGGYGHPREITLKPRARYDLGKACARYATHVNSQWLSKDRMLQTYARSQFAFSPAGAGVDCHRHWEALGMGAIPIIKRTAGVEDTVFAGQPVMLVDEWEDVCNANFSRTLQSVAQRLEHTAGTLDPRHWLPWCKQGQFEGAPFGVTFEGSAVLSAS